jgi:hypothetical protein
MDNSVVKLSAEASTRERVRGFTGTYRGVEREGGITGM